MWFNLPATQLTPEIEKDMKIMKMRNILDRKRHYKKNDSSVLPKYFQVSWILKCGCSYREIMSVSLQLTNLLVRLTFCNQL